MDSYMDEACKNAAKAYLKTCSSGGMPDKEVEVVQKHVDAMGDLHYFAMNIAEALKENGYKVVKA